MIRPGYVPGDIVVVNGAQQLFAQSLAIELAGEGSGSRCCASLRRVRAGMAGACRRGHRWRARLRIPEAERLYAAWMPGFATRIIVSGRGLVADGAGFRLTRQSSERAEALVAYVRQNAAGFAARRGRIVFSGGWAGAAEGFGRPPRQYREGSLMLAQAMSADIGGASLADYADVYAEIESDSTLENVLRVKEDGYFGSASFTAGNPLGLVAHLEHLPRVCYLVRKAFGLPGGAMVAIAAPGPENSSGGLPESVLLPVTRMVFLGVRDHSSLRGRHRTLVAWSRRLRALP
jgi:DUF218 domain